MKNHRFITHPLFLIGLGALGGLAVVKGLAAIPKERMPKRLRAGFGFGAQEDAALPTSPENPADRKEWVVLYSAHEGAYHYGGSEPQTPPPPMTFCAARDAAINYEQHSKAIAGRAVLKNVVTGKEIFEF